MDRDNSHRFNDCSSNTDNWLDPLIRYLYFSSEPGVVQIYQDVVIFFIVSTVSLSSLAVYFVDCFHHCHQGLGAWYVNCILVSENDEKAFQRTFD